MSKIRIAQYSRWCHDYLLCINMAMTWMLCTLTSFRVLRAPESCSIYFFQPFSTNEQKSWKRLKKSVSTSFQVCTAPKAGQNTQHLNTGCNKSGILMHLALVFESILYYVCYKMAPEINKVSQSVLIFQQEFVQLSFFSSKLKFGPFNLKNKSQVKCDKITPILRAKNALN